VLETASQLESRYRASGGVEVTLGAVTTWGHFDEDDAVEGDDFEVVVAGPRVTVASGIFPAIARGAGITVDGEAFKIVEPLRIRGGAETLIRLASS